MGKYFGALRRGAISKYVRVNPRKARLVARAMKGLPVVEAKTRLQFYNTKASRYLYKTLNTAIAVAENELEVDRESLVVSEIRVDQGPSMKRAKSRSRGGRSPILKRTSHLTVVVEREGF